METVFQSHEREDALALLTPSFRLYSESLRPPGISVGTRVELRVVLFRWVALHTAYEKSRFFVDEQIEGTLAHWVHRQEFEEVGDRTRLTDRIEYRLPGGPVLNALPGWAVVFGLRRMFAHRYGRVPAVVRGAIC